MIIVKADMKFANHCIPRVPLVVQSSRETVKSPTRIAVRKKQLKGDSRTRIPLSTPGLRSSDIKNGFHYI